MDCGVPNPPQCVPPGVPPIPAMSCPSPTPAPPCRPKPVMRGLHWAQTKSKIAQALILSCLAGSAVYFCIGRPRRARYKEYHQKSEFDEWADEMARKGLFQSVPKESFQQK